MSDLLGYAAASAVLASFMMRSMTALRLIAILSNILFLSYGHIAHIYPVFLLHTTLLPINIARLAMHRDSGALFRQSRDRCLALATDGFRRSALFILGLTAGSFGIRAFVHAAFTLFDYCQHNSL
jgi:hypothetical protein